MEINKIYVGNNIDILKTFPDNSIDSIVTDPPYGLGKEPNAVEVLQSWITTGYHEIKGKGFMGSGTTAIACKSEKINYIGCEIDEEYVKIAEARIKAEVVQYDIFDFMGDNK